MLAPLPPAPGILGDALPDCHNCRRRKIRPRLRKLQWNVEHLGVSRQQLSLALLALFLLLDDPEKENPEKRIAQL